MQKFTSVGEVAPYYFENFERLINWNFMLCDNGSYFDKLLFNHNKLSVALMLIKSND